MLADPKDRKGVWRRVHCSRECVLVIREDIMDCGWDQPSQVLDGEIKG